MVYRGGDADFEVRVPDLRELLADLKDFSPRLARDIRRDLRRSGEEVIASQKAILSGPLPGGVVHTGYRNGRDSLGRRRRLATFQDTATSTANGRRTTRLRADIAKGLKVRVVAGKTRQGIELKTSGPRRDGYNMARVYQARVFRHPAFGEPDSWVYQKGQPYFWGPAFDGLDAMRGRVDEALGRAVAALAGRSSPST